MLNTLDISPASSLYSLQHIVLRIPSARPLTTAVWSSRLVLVDLLRSYVIRLPVDAVPSRACRFGDRRRRR